MRSNLFIYLFFRQKTSDLNRFRQMILDESKLAVFLRKLTYNLHVGECNDAIMAIVPI